MNNWYKKNFGEHQFPALFSALFTFIGALLTVHQTTLIAAVGSFSGCLFGYIIGAALQPEIIRFISSKNLAKRKMLQDFQNSALRRRVNFEMILETLNKRFAVLKQKKRLQRATPIQWPAGTDVPFPRASENHRTLETIDPHLLNDADALKVLPPITVNCIGIAIGAIAVLNSLRVRYGLPILIDKDDRYGVSQIKTIAADATESVDFLITPEAPFLLSSAGKLDRYYRLFPVFSEEQRVLRKEGKNTKWMEVLYLMNSTCEEQLIMGNDIPPNSKPVGVVLFDELEERMAVMRSGDSAILWEPVATLYSKKAGYDLEAGVYLNWFCCYCHARWFDPLMEEKRKSFIRLFINEWNYCTANPIDTFKRFYRADTGFVEQFKLNSLSK